ncbi:hypothetical protein MCETHM1_02910 [Flavobacteriaceae bacterium]
MKNKKAKSIFSSLEDFNSIPPPELWDKIEAQLEQPKKKKRALIWWSVAASLLIGLAVPTTLYYNSNQGNFKGNSNFKDNGVVNVNPNKNKNTSIDKNKKEKETRIVNAKTNLNAKRNNNNKTDKSHILINTTNSIATTAVSNNSSEIKKHSGFKNIDQQKKNLNNPTSKQEARSRALVANQNSISVISKTELVNGKSVQENNSNGSKKAVVNNENNSIFVSKSNKVILANAISKSELAIGMSSHSNNSNGNDKIIENSSNTTVSKSKHNNSTVLTANAKDSVNNINKEIAQLENALVQQDKEKTKKTKEKVSDKIDKWSLQVFAGVMSSQNYNNQKALGNTLASQQTSGYGVKTNYKLNKKWGVSSGIKINELGQKIDGVSYYNQQSYSGLVTGSLPNGSNVNFINTSKSDYELVSISNNEGYLFASNSKADTPFEKGNVTQNLKYFEMPLEVSYAILSKKKANITMNTGGFVGKLISNDIALNGNSIGENNNVKEYVYGTLLSSTLQYEIYKKTKFFIEPGMNYYINPLENQSFNQFQWMFNVGLNVSF